MDSNTAPVETGQPSPAELHRHWTRRLVWLPLAVTALGLGVLWGALRPGMTAVVQTEVTSRLLAVQSAKARHLESVLLTRRSLLAEQAEAPNLTLRRALRDFSQARESLLTELQTMGQPFSPEMKVRVRQGLTAYYETNLVQSLKAAGVTRGGDATRLVPSEDADLLLQYVYVMANPMPYGRKAEWGSSADVAALADLPRPFAEALSRTTYAMVHTEMHPRLRRLASRLEGDRLLCDASGQVVYSVDKRFDFARSVKPAGAGAAGVGAAWREALAADPALAARDATRVSDVEGYLFHLGAPVGWLAQPITDEAGKRPVGACLASFDAGRFDAILAGGPGAEAPGVGRTEDLFLVGSDRMLRSASRVARSQANADRVAGEAAVRLFAPGGASGWAVYRNGSGREVVGAWTPLNVPGLRYGLVSEIDRAEVASRAGRLWLFLAGGMALVLLALGLVMKSITARVVNALEDVALHSNEAQTARTQAELARRDQNKLAAECGELSAQKAAIEQELEQLETMGEEVGGNPDVPGSIRHPALASFVARVHDLVASHTQGRLAALAQVRSAQDELRRVSTVLGRLAADGRLDKALPQFSRPEVGEAVAKLAGRLADQEARLAARPGAAEGDETARLLEQARWMREDVERVRAAAARLAAGDLTAEVPQVLVAPVNEIGSVLRRLASDARSAAARPPARGA